MWVDDQYIAFDFETSGKLPEYALQPWRVAHNQAWATSLATVRRTEGGPIIGGGLLVAEPFTATARHIRELLITAIEHKLTLVGWNVAFDISWLLAYGFRDLVFKCKFLDGMLLWKHLTVTPEYDTDKAHKKSFSLKAAVREFMPDRGGYEEDIDFRATDPESLARLHKYNIQDTAYTLWLTRKFYKQLVAEPARLKAALIEASCLPLVADANLRGLMLDRAALRTLGETLTADAETALAALSPYGVTEAVVRSPKQLGDLMYGQWGLPVIKQNTSKKTGKVTNSTDKEVLHELAFIDARARTTREYREALGNKTKFVDAPLESINYNSDGCSHPLANVYSTYTGRMSYSSKQGKNKDERQIGFALHQEKRDPTYRAIVVPPQGYTLVEFDAAGQEYRWMAVASKDDAMLQLCLPGEDPHGYMGAQIAREEYHALLSALKAGDPAAKPKRQLGKLANLSLGYRTSAAKLRVKARVDYDLPMELPEAEYIKTTYLRSYPGVPRYWAAQISKVRRLGYAETFAGRQVQVVGTWSGATQWSLESTALNFPIQGTGGDQKYLALAVLRPYVVKHGIQFAWELHDGLYFYIPTKLVDKAIAEMKFLLDNLPYAKAWGFTPPIPMPWDCKVGTSWGNLKEVKA